MCPMGGVGGMLNFLLGIPQIKNVFIVVFCRGVHIVVATPGRLMDLLDKKILNVAICRYEMNGCINDFSLK